MSRVATSALAFLLLAAVSSLSSCEPSAPEPVGKRALPVEINLSPLEAVQPEDASLGDRFGLGVATTGDWLVAARYVVLSDSVQVLASRSTSTGWSPPSLLLPTDVATTRWLSPAVSVHDESMPEALVGTGQADGAVLVFDLQSGSQVQRINSPSTERQRFGAAIAARNSWMAVGDYLEGPLGAEPGAVHMYGRGGNGWTFSQSLGPGASVGSRFGRTLALSDNYLAVGAPEEDESGTKTAGAVHVFALANGTWTLQQTLFAPSPQSDSQFGYAVAMSDDALFIVSRFDSAFASQAGAVYVFERSGTSWAFVERLGSMTPKPRGGFGQSIAFDGELLGVGELADPGQSGGDQRGSVSTYHRVGNTWQLLERLVPEAGLGSNTARFGAVQDLRNDRLVIGAPDLETSNDQSGFVASWSVIHTETNGTCFDGIECTTGNCVDGVCCDLPCAGTCEACSAAKKGYGEDGVCEPIQAGLDPDEECPADPTAANACAPESACSGDASCSCIVPGTLQCSSEIERIDENGNQVSCVPFRCRANTCLTTCNSSADCSDGARCNSERRCETAENHASSSSDSGCSMGRSGNRAPLWPLGALVALWFIARRRKLAFS